MVPYLVFPGTCKKAMMFYSGVLGGEITILTTFGDSPVDVPPEAEGRIFNAEVQAGGIRIKASDDLPGHDVKMGTHVSLFVTFPDQETKRAAFEKLSAGGEVLFPLDDDFGMLRDKYGMQWMFVHAS